MSVWLLLFLIATCGVLLVGLSVRRAMFRGATASEISSSMTGDDWLGEMRWSSTRMTRAIDIDVPASLVWPWLEQLGRGAGWYSWDRLDNGGRRSATHLVSWIPQVALGDASAIGYVRSCTPGSEIAWWLDETPFTVSTVRSVVTYELVARQSGDTSRLIMRVQADARGPGAPAVVLLFPVIDSIMAIRQMKSLKYRAEGYGSRAEDPLREESGRRDQYQLYEALYASGGSAGVVGKEQATLHRRRAIRDGVIIDLSDD